MVNPDEVAGLPVASREAIHLYSIFPGVGPGKWKTVIDKHWITEHVVDRDPRILPYDQCVKDLSQLELKPLTLTSSAGSGSCNGPLQHLSERFRLSPPMKGKEAMTSEDYRQPRWLTVQAGKDGMKVVSRHETRREAEVAARYQNTTVVKASDFSASRNGWFRNTWTTTREALLFPHPHEF